MPFTGSHPVAVLPFLRTPLPGSALVAGSLAPDLPHYLPVVGLGRPTHTAPALVTIDLALGALLWAVWHGLVAAPALHVAPRAVRARLAGHVELGLRRRMAARPLGLALLAVVIGAATHVSWDEFTHPGRFGAEHVAVLADSWAGRPGYRWAQEASGVLGAAVLTGWLLRWWRRTEPAVVDRRPGAWWPPLVVAATATTGGISAAVGAGDLRSAAVAAAFRGGGIALAAVVLLALAWHLRHRPGGDR